MSLQQLEKVPSFYHNYINQVPEENLDAAFAKHTNDLVAFLKSISEQQWEHRYAPDKWSIKEVVQHLIDSERIFCFRALSFARKEEQELPGFKENEYAAASKADRRNAEDLIEEMHLVQQCSAKLFASFDEEQLQEKGVANKKQIFVEAIGYIIIGHCRHHAQIIKERYL